MRWVRDILGGVADPAARYGEARQRSRQTEVIADAAVEQTRIEAARDAVDAGRSTWRPKWMHAIRRLLVWYFGLSFAGAVTAFGMLASVFFAWSDYSQWAQVRDELEWFLASWVALGGSLITVATWSFLGYSPFRSLQEIAAGGGDNSIVTRTVRRLLPGQQGSARDASPQIVREPMQQRTGDIERRLDGIVLPPRTREPNAIDPDLLARQIEREEGRVESIYTDSLGHRTAGVGHLLTPSDGHWYAAPAGTIVPPDLVDAWYAEDLQDAIRAARTVVRGFDDLPQQVKHLLANMAFQLGGAGLARFERMIAAIERHDWRDAATEALDSRAARQTPNRWARHAAVLRSLAGADVPLA